MNVALLPLMSLSGSMVQDSSRLDLTHHWTGYLALGIFAANTGGYALTFWLPTTVKSISGGTVQATLYYSCLFYTCGLVSVFLSGQSSDRSGDRKWHCVAGLAATALFLVGSTIPGQP